MKVVTAALWLFALPACCVAQAPTKDVSTAQLQAVLDLPLGQAVARREVYKVPLKAAYERQMALVGKDCTAASDQGQQPYNICMGHEGVQADADFASFYDNLQMLCHDQAQLSGMQTSERVWEKYRDSAMESARAAWANGTGAPGFSGEVYLNLVRDRMRELREIFGLNVAQ